MCTPEEIRVCEDTLAEHKERLAELKGLVAQIASDVGLDAGGPLQSEVEALGRRLEDVRETLSSLADTADARAIDQELACGDLCQTKNFLDSVHESITTVSQGESKEQLEVLRNHLLALTRTEPQLQSIKERALEITPGREPSIVEVLQLWQRVFRETFQQYHRLSARLVRSQDVAAALRLWQEYLGHVQEFLSSSVPGDYNGLAEHRNLCEVHRNLLTEQQHLVQMVRSEEGRDLSIAEQFNALTNLHNESLARIMERHAAVRERLAAWERYRQDQSKLLAWLKDLERDRGRLQLRFIHARRIDKILQRIEGLLDRLPAGESQADALQRQQDVLLPGCDEALALSVRMEHAASVQRMSNIRASLETWKDYVLKIRGLNEKHAEQTAKVTTLFQQTSQAIAAIDDLNPGSLAETRRQLDSLQKHKARLVASTTDLEALGVSNEQLRESLSPSDMKSLNQQSFLLWQQHGELEHQLALLSYKLGERCSLHSRWESRSSRLLVWMRDTEDRIHSCDAANLDEPEEALKKLECEVQAEMALKQRELEWVQSNGLDLMSVAEPNEKQRLEKVLEEVNERWNNLLSAGKARANKILDLMQTMSTLQKRLAEIRQWLGTVETQLSEAYSLESAAKASVDKKLKDHEQLQKTIEGESGNVGEVLNLCEILLSDCDAWKASFNTDAIKAGMEGLECRWKATCVKSSERKRKIMLTGKLLTELETTRLEHEQWVAGLESELDELEKSLSDLSKDNTEKTMAQAQRIQEDIKAHDPALHILEQCYSRLAKGGLEPENLRALTIDTRQLIDRWHGLTPKINTIVAALQKDQKIYREFISAHGAAIIGLTQVDVTLTQVQHLSAPVKSRTSPGRRLQQLSDVESELARQGATLRRADELALQLMHESHPDDVARVQELVDEYQLLWRDIKNRVDALRDDLESQERQEVDEAVQVETLKFEKDTAVQVDTLPKSTRMTSFDAYLIELESAISECRVALDALESAVIPEPTPGTGLSTAARNIAKLIGSSQSTIELVKHLHNLLSEEEQIAKASDIAALTSRYEDLLRRARAREQQIRELKSPLAGAYCFPCEHDGGRLTCPLCSHRNWAQLDNDLWRLEKWLEFAEGTQSEQRSPPSNIEQLEDVIQDHREFLLDLDSHKSIVVSLNIVGAHLADHTEDIERANELRDRLDSANVRWEKVCQTAGKWEKALQAALMGNQQFHRIIDELLVWLEVTEESIRASEPIDLTEQADVLRAKYDKFRELQADLERCEPRVLSLQEAANHLLEEHADTRERLQELRLRLQSLRRLTSMYVLKLGAALGLDPRDVGLAATATSLAALSRDLLDDAASGTTQAHGTHTVNADDGEQTVLARGYHFIGRVLRASLPIQALMLLLLGAASLVPSAEEDYSCMLSNNLARSFTPLVQYPNGPPPL